MLKLDFGKHSSGKHSPGKYRFGKYRGIILSVALFLLLDASVLMLNFYISFEIADDANSVNLAGRQRMLSQRMVKSLFEFEQSLAEPSQADRALAELKLTYGLFDRTLTAFAEGGRTTNADNQAVTVAQVSSESGRAALAEAQSLWDPYVSRFQRVFQEYERQPRHPDTRDALNELKAYASANNLALLALMNDLTVDLEQVAASKAIRLRTIQTVGISLAVINFLIILFHFLRQLRESDAKIEAARKETSDILSTVNEGLFLIRSDLTMGSQHSHQLLDIFGIQTVAGQPVENLLRDIVSEKDLKTALGFIRLLFNENIKEKLTGDLNPLRGIEVNISGDNGNYQTKYLNFDFARVSSPEGIEEVLVTVTDITRQVKLERELAESKVQSEQQLEMLTSILHTNPATLKTFLSSAYQSFGEINEELKKPLKGGYQYQQKIRAIFAVIHHFKGEAGALQLDRFAAMAHDFETTLAELGERPELRGNDFLDLTVQLDRLMSYTDAVQNLVERLAEFSQVNPAQGGVLTAASRRWDHLETLVQDISARQNKQVVLATSGLQEAQLDKPLAKVINGICIQLLRNSVSHGIESPAERMQSQKRPEGRIDLRLVALPNGNLELTVEDDGRGIDCEALRRKALASGRWSRELIETWDSKRLISLIFNAGFSTAEQVSEDAGRGVGMDVVMQQVQASGGRLTVSHKAGRYCRFVVTLPQTLSAQVAA